MAWTNLPTNYTDASWSGNRKYQQITNSDGTVSFVDKTVYTNKENSFFGAKDANQTNDGINQAMAQLASIDTAYKAADSNLQKLLNTEISNRTSGDNNLLSTLTAQINTVQQNLNTASSNLTSKDNSLQTSINTLNANITNLTNILNVGSQYYYENVDWRTWRGKYFAIYKFEGSIQYNIPKANCIIIVCRNQTRGVAMGMPWTNGRAGTNNEVGSGWIPASSTAAKYNFRFFTNSLHDDTGKDAWYEWAAFYLQSAYF